MSAQKALQGSETETGELLEGRNRIVFPRQGVIHLPYRQINDFLPFWPSLYLSACAPSERNSDHIYSTRVGCVGGVVFFHLQVEVGGKDEEAAALVGVAGEQLVVVSVDRLVLLHQLLFEGRPPFERRSGH